MAYDTIFLFTNQQQSFNDLPSKLTIPAEP